MAFAKVEQWLWRFKKQRPFPPNHLYLPSRTFIVPTGFGILFGVLSSTLVILAISNNNNLIYLISFFLIMMGLLSLWLTNNNVSKIEVVDIKPEAMRCQQASHVLVTLWNRSKNTHLHELQVGFTRRRFFVQAPMSEDLILVPTLKPLERLTVKVPYLPVKRGRQSLPTVQIQSFYPFELTRAWKPLREPLQVLVFPQAKGNDRLPTSAAHDQQGSANAGLFEGYRYYIPGDSQRRIDWRVSMRRQELLVRQFSDQQAASYIFKWEDTSHLTDFEDRVSQLAYWVESCERRQFNYGLLIGAHRSNCEQGDLHLEKCLETLALLQPKDLAEENLKEESLKQANLKQANLKREIL